MIYTNGDYFIASHLAKTKPSKKTIEIWSKTCLLSDLQDIVEKLDIAGLDVYLVELEML